MNPGNHDVLSLSLPRVLPLFSPAHASTPGRLHHHGFPVYGRFCFGEYTTAGPTRSPADGWLGYCAFLLLLLSNRYFWGMESGSGWGPMCAPWSPPNTLLLTLWTTLSPPGVIEAAFAIFPLFRFFFFF